MKKIKFTSYSYCKPIKPLCKQYGIWLNGVNGKNISSPLAYFQKPKWIEEKEWLRIMKQLGFIEN